MLWWLHDVLEHTAVYYKKSLNLHVGTRMASLDLEGALRGAAGPRGLVGCSFCAAGSECTTTEPVSGSEIFSTIGLSKPPTMEGLGDGMGRIISGAESLQGGS
jgi:hypothetical protein